MEKKGLCITCVRFENCIFSKKQPVWQCEEFCDGSPDAKKSKHISVKQASYAEAATESE